MQSMVLWLFNGLLVCNGINYRAYSGHSWHFALRNGPRHPKGRVESMSLYCTGLSRTVSTPVLFCPTIWYKTDVVKELMGTSISRQALNSLEMDWRAHQDTTQQTKLTCPTDLRSPAEPPSRLLASLVCMPTFVPERRRTTERAACWTNLASLLVDGPVYAIAALGLTAPTNTVDWRGGRREARQQKTRFNHELKLPTPVIKSYPKKIVKCGEAREKEVLVNALQKNKYGRAGYRR